MFKKILALTLALFMFMSSYRVHACGKSNGSRLFILIGDETEGYTKAHGRHFGS